MPCRRKFRDLGIGRGILVTHVNHTQGKPPPLTWCWMSINLALREYTTLPVPEPLPSTGSFDFRQGVYNHRSMTVREQNFEQFVNVRQAEHDIRSSINEWERLRALEEDAIQLWQDLDGNLAEYQRQMRTRDQQAMEFQCQRKKEKERKLQLQTANSIFYAQEYLNAVARREFKEAVTRRAMEFAARRVTTEAQNSGTTEFPARSVITEAQRPGATKFPARRFITEAQEPEAMEFPVCRVLTEAEKSEAKESAAQEALEEQEAIMKTFKFNFAEFAADKMKKAAAATNAQKRPSEVAYAADGVRSDLGADLGSGGESSHSPFPQHSGSADSVSRDPGSPSLPTKQPIDNTVRPPRTSPRQPPITQSSRNSSDSPSPPRSTSVENSTPPSSKDPSPPESLKSSPPKTPSASRFAPDPAIWGTSILPSSSNHPSALFSQPPSFNPSQTNTPKIPPGFPDLTSFVKINTLRFQRPQPVLTTNMNGPMLREQSRHDIPTGAPFRTVGANERTVELPRRNVQEMTEKKPSGLGDHFVTIIVRGPPGGGVGRY